MSHSRKRKGGIKLDSSGGKCGAGSGSESGESTGVQEEDEEGIETDLSETKKNKKSRVDDLWASFKKDVGGPVSSFSSGSPMTSHIGSTKSAGVSGGSSESVSRGEGSASSGTKGKVHFVLAGVSDFSKNDHMYEFCQYSST